MSNPRNTNTNTTVGSEEQTKSSPDDWKFLTLGSLAVRDGKKLVRDYEISFVINPRNAQVIRDAAQFVMDNPVDAEGKDQRISVNASPFFEGAASENTLKYFTHRLYLSAETIAKWGKKLSEYVVIKSA